MPLKAFFYLLRNPGLADVKAFRSLIFKGQDLTENDEREPHAFKEKNEDVIDENIRERR